MKTSEMSRKRCLTPLILFVTLIFNVVILKIASQASLDKINIMAVFSMFFLLCFFLFYSSFFIYRLYKLLKNKQKITQSVFLYTLVLPVLFLFLLGFNFIFFDHIMCSKARSYIKCVLGEMDPEQVNVIIDNKQVPQAKKWFAALSAIEKGSPHHSHAEGKVMMQTGDSKHAIVLLIGRDSNRKDEFWVYLPMYYYTKTNEIGRIHVNFNDSMWD